MPIIEQGNGNWTGYYDFTEEEVKKANEDLKRLWGNRERPRPIAIFLIPRESPPPESSN